MVDNHQNEHGLNLTLSQIQSIFEAGKNSAKLDWRETRLEEIQEFISYEYTFEEWFLKNKQKYTSSI